MFYKHTYISVKSFDALHTNINHMDVIYIRIKSPCQLANILQI